MAKESTARNHLTPVPDKNKPRPVGHRATTTSFRIPVVWYNRVQEEADRRNTSLSAIYLQAITDFFGAFSTDSWETSGDHEVYDPTRFYTKSQDGHGHSITIHVPIPKPLAGEIANLTQSGIIPAYRSTADVVRDALYHRVKRIATMLDNGELDTSVNMAMMMSDEMLLMSEAEEARNLISAVKDNAARIYGEGNGSVTRLKKYLAEKREMADSMPEQYRPDLVEVIEGFEKRITKSRRKK